MSSFPFHVLMLPESRKPPGSGTDAVEENEGGGVQDQQQPEADEQCRAQASASASPPLSPSPPSPTPLPEENIPEDDYLLTRHRYQMAKVEESSSASSSGKGGAKSAGERDSKKGDGGSQQSVPVCTPIEIAIINCCKSERRKRGEINVNKICATKKEKWPEETKGSSTPMEESGSADESNSDIRSPANRVTINGNKSSNSNGSSSNSNNEDASANGYLAEGKEGQFASLIALNCHTIWDRALALAVLERTMEHDKYMEKRRKQKRKCKRGKLESQNDNEDNDEGDERQRSSPSKTIEEADIDSRSCRMANFLSAGGLKVLNQWLVDSFTPIESPTPSTQSSSKKRGSKRKRKDSQEDRDAGPETSPTGPIILPLLSILESIPFRADLIIECRINKQVKKLKKNLEKLIGASANKKGELEKKLNALDEDFCHPLSGGMPVVTVYKRMEEMMATWTRAMADEKKQTDISNGSGDKGSSSSPPPADYYRGLKAKMAERLGTLSKFEAGEGPKPTWLADLDPKGAANKGKLLNPEEAARQRQMKEKAAASAKAAKEKADEEKRRLEAKRRRIQLQEELNAENAAIEENKRKL